MMILLSIGGNMEGCIFCRIANDQSPAQMEYQDDDVVVFWDMQPLAPVHLLIVPKRHIASLADCTDAELDLLGHMALVAVKVACDKGLAQDGYRVVINQGNHGGQIIEHLHMHLLGGAPLGNIVTTEQKTELS